MDNEENFIYDFSKLEGSLINAEEKFGVPWCKGGTKI